MKLVMLWCYPLVFGFEKLRSCLLIMETWYQGWTQNLSCPLGGSLRTWLWGPACIETKNIGWDVGKVSWLFFNWTSGFWTVQLPAVGLRWFMPLLGATQPWYQQLPEDACVWGAVILGAVKLVQSQRWGSKAQRAWGDRACPSGQESLGSSWIADSGTDLWKTSYYSCLQQEPALHFLRQSSYLQLDQSLFLYIPFPRGIFRWDAALHPTGTSCF